MGCLGGRECILDLSWLKVHKPLGSNSREESDGLGLSETALIGDAIEEPKSAKSLVARRRNSKFENLILAGGLENVRGIGNGI